MRKWMMNVGPQKGQIVKDKAINKQTNKIL